ADGAISANSRQPPSDQLLRKMLKSREMSFWSGYWASLKPREVEETIDVYVHRPLAYVLARALYPLPISPDVVTALSILAGIASAVSLLVPFPHHLQAG